MKLNRITAGCSATVLAKIEGRDPAFSVKCRLGAAMICDAEKQGLLGPGKHLVEPTSANSGIALAFAAAARKTPLTLTMPETMSLERQKLLIAYATECLSRINGLRITGTADEKVGVQSFVLPNRRTEDIGRHLNNEGIAVRSGHHCSQPALRRFGLETTVRPSLSFYNAKEDIDCLVAALERIQTLPG